MLLLSRKFLRTNGFFLATALFCLVFTHSLRAEISRGLPKTLASHPGNIFLAGENVVVAAPPGEVNTWRMNNYDDEVIAKGEIKDGKIDLGKLPVGYYKIVRGAPGQFTNRTFIGVLDPLRAPAPLTSPIAIDVGMAWFWPDSQEKMREVANPIEIVVENPRIKWRVAKRKPFQFSSSISARKNWKENGESKFRKAGQQIFRRRQGSRRANEKSCRRN